LIEIYSGNMNSKVSDILFQIPHVLETKFERDFDVTNTVQFAKEHYIIPFTLVSIYMVFCFFGVKKMREREPFDLRYPLALWNAFLSIFSFIGLLKTVPFLLGSILTRSYEDTICMDPTKPIGEGFTEQSWGSGPTGMWVMLFIFSKVPELIDTVFIVLRKKPLIFLHWYHHVTVLLYCWDAYSTMAGSGLYFVAMNYSVHALMYGYYCLQALHLCPKSFPTYLITLSQITQMFVGTFVCISSWYYVLSGRQCHNTQNNLIAGGLMYGSYLYLFVDFAINRFLRKKKPSAKKNA
jgi:elongation of very long chain fatty acids protein 6